MQGMELVAFSHHTLDVIGSGFDDDELNEGIATKAMTADLSTVALSCFAQKDEQLYEVIGRISYFSGPHSLGIYNNIFPGMSSPLQPLGHKVCILTIVVRTFFVRLFSVPLLKRFFAMLSCHRCRRCCYDKHTRSHGPDLRRVMDEV